MGLGQVCHDTHPSPSPLSLSPGCCNRMLSGTGGDDDSHNDDPKFFIDEETMKIIR